MIINANALHIPLADKCVHTVVTSPPYYGLRDYGVNGQLGLEPTPDEYIANLVAVFRECKRVLRDDGTLWVNIGDSFAGSGVNDGTKNPGISNNANRSDVTGTKRPNTNLNGYKPKDLIGIPWMLAFALRADGWYLRSDIIWAKKNCMPESVKDRPTKSHEYIFLLSKSQKYYYDNEAVKEPQQDISVKRAYSTNNVNDRKDADIDKLGYAISGTSQNKTYERMREKIDNGWKPVRNKRDVWYIATKPYKGAHYAVFPPELIKPCILAGAPENGIVFDPFVGSGTTVATAIQLGRKGIGLDLSFKYLHENATERIDKAKLPLFGNSTLDTWKI